MKDMIISPSAVRMPVGGDVQLTVVGGNGAPKWSSSNPTAITVDGTGKVNAKALGASAVSCKRGNTTKSATVVAIEAAEREPSPNGTCVPPSQDIVDLEGWVWTLAGNAIMLNGMDSTGRGSQLSWRLVDGTLLLSALNQDGQWWSWKGQWVPAGPNEPGVPLPSPVDCVLGPPQDWTTVSVVWEPCAGETQSGTKTETGVRPILTAPMNGGAACGPTTVTRTTIVTRACVVTPPPSTGKTLLNPLTDLRLKGYMRLDYDDFRTGGMTFRWVNGKRYWFIYGNTPTDSTPIREYEDTRDYRMNHLESPKARLVKDWGSDGKIYGNLRRAKFDDGTIVDLSGKASSPGDMHWNEKNQLLYWSYLIDYAVSGGQLHSLGASKLNSDGTSIPYGQWRILNKAGRGGHRAAMFISEHPLTGKMFCGGGYSSGGAALAWGPDASSGLDFPIATTPAGFDAPDLQLTDQLMSYWYPAFAPITTEELIAAGKSPYAPNSENFVNQDGTITGYLRSFKRPLGDYVACQTASGMYVDPLKMGYGSWTELDAQTGMLYIDLPTKHAIIATATLVGNGDHQGQPTVEADGHVFYKNEAMGNAQCKHGFGGNIEITGQVGTNNFTAMMGFDPADSEKIRTGAMRPFDAPVRSYVNLQKHLGVKSAPWNMPGGGAKLCFPKYDPATKELFIICRNADRETYPGIPTDLIAVFDVLG